LLQGEVDSIERKPGKTEVLIDEGVQLSVIQLDEGLIEFGAALDNNELQR
jgi:hypothetical protein